MIVWRIKIVGWEISQEVIYILRKVEILGYYECECRGGLDLRNLYKEYLEFFVIIWNMVGEVNVRVQEVYFFNQVDSDSKCRRKRIVRGGLEVRRLMSLYFFDFFIGY